MLMCDYLTVTHLSTVKVIITQSKTTEMVTDKTGSPRKFIFRSYIFEQDGTGGKKAKVRVI